jgi:hypothetical protein
LSKNKKERVAKLEKLGFCWEKEDARFKDHTSRKCSIKTEYTNKKVNR